MDRHTKTDLTTHPPASLIVTLTDLPPNEIMRSEHRWSSADV